MRKVERRPVTFTLSATPVKTLGVTIKKTLVPRLNLNSVFSLYFFSTTPKVENKVLRYEILVWCYEIYLFELNGCYLNIRETEVSGWPRIKLL